MAKPRAECFCHWQRWRELEACSDADWSGDSPTRRSVSAGVVMRGGHCLNVWAKRQQVMAMSTAESELWAAVKSASESFGIQSMAKDMGIKCWLKLHLDAASTLRLVNRLGLGMGKHVDMPNLRIQEVPKSKKFVTKNVRGQVNPADLMTKPPPRPPNRAADEGDVIQVSDGRVQREEGQIARIAKGAGWRARCLVEDARREVGEHAAQLRF